MMNRIVNWLLSASLFVVFTSPVFALCPEGSNWTESWIDSFSQTTYTLTAPCKAYIGIPFDITASVTDSTFPDSDVGVLWSIKDNGAAILGSGFNWITLVSGSWQKTYQQTYTGTPIDHTIAFTFTDLGQGPGGHNIAGNTIGAITVDPLPPDSDGDGIYDFNDNCPLIANPDQADNNGNGIGDPCDYPALLPKTGQTTSGTPGDDGALQRGVDWPSPRFNVVGDGTVADNLTGLIWAADASAPTVDTCLGGAMTWQSALDYVACLNLNNYLGHNDWLLPNLNELKSLVDLQASFPSVTPSAPFTGIFSSDYWSSSSNDPFTVNAWSVYMGNGLVAYNNKNDVGYIWPIRSARWGTASLDLPATGQATSYANGDDGALPRGVSAPSSRFTDNNDGTVTDNLTGLIWLQNANCFSAQNWDAALITIANLEAGSCNLTDDSAPGSWRLPNRNELSSLIDLAQSYPALPVDHPFNAQAMNYWSSSSYLDSDAWSVGIGDGYILNFNKTSTFYLWPVRDVLPSFHILSVTRSSHGSVSTNVGTLTWSDTVAAANYAKNTVVTLSAIPDSGYAFAGWSGACTGTGICQVTMDEAKSVTATFAPPCGNIPWIYTPLSNASGYYQVRWGKSSTLGVTYKLYENGSEIYSGVNTYANLTAKSNGTYAYTVEATKDGYAASALNGPVNTVVTLTCGNIPWIYPPISNSTGYYQVRWGKSSTLGVTYKLYENGSEIYSGVNTYANLTAKSNGTYIYTVQATKDGYSASDLHEPVNTTVLLTCGNIPSLYAPASNSTGLYQVRWNKSSTVGVTYILYENGSEIYRGPATFLNFTGQGNGSYSYTIQAIKDGYLDSDLKGPVVVTVAK